MRPLSVVVPLYNEAQSLPELCRQLSAMAEANRYALQIVLVDDGSRDGSWDVIVRLAQEDPRIEGVRLRRNFGKAAALSAGFGAATAPVVVTLDADLQDDPYEVPKLIAELDGELLGGPQSGLDVVSGWKRDRHDPWHKTWPSWVFNRLVSWLMGVPLHDHNCGLKAYRAEVLDEVRLYGELHRFVPVLAHARGFRVGEVAVNHRRRQFGVSKYGVSRLVKGLLDLLTVKLITGYGDRPQHLLGGLGLGAFLLGGLGLAYLAIAWCVSRIASEDPIHLHNTAMLYYALGLFIIGAQFLSVGLLGEMLTAHHLRDGDAYSVSARVGGSSPPLGSQSEVA